MQVSTEPDFSYASGYYSETPPSFSPNIGHLAKALGSAQKEFKPIVANAHAIVERGVHGTSYEYDYIKLDKLIKDVTDILSKHGLSVTGFLEQGYINLLLMHESGQWIRSRWKAFSDSDKLHWQGQNITYKRRQMLLALLNIHAGTDDDGNEADGNTYASSHNELAKKKGKQMSKQTADKLKKKISFDISGIKAGSERPENVVNQYVNSAMAVGINVDQLTFSRSKYKDVKDFVRKAPKSVIKTTFEVAYLQLASKESE